MSITVHLIDTFTQHEHAINMNINRLPVRASKGLKDMAAPVGNDNKVKNKPWADAIARAVARKAKGDKDAGLNIIADQLVSAAINGDQWAIKEIGDRIDGKAAQSVALTNPEGGDLFAPLVSAAEALRGKIREAK